MPKISSLLPVYYSSSRQFRWWNTQLYIFLTYSFPPPITTTSVGCYTYFKTIECNEILYAIHSLICNPSLNIRNCITSHEFTENPIGRSLSLFNYKIQWRKRGKWEKKEREREQLQHWRKMFSVAIACVMRDNVVSHSCRRRFFFFFFFS